MGWWLPGVLRVSKLPSSEIVQALLVFPEEVDIPCVLVGVSVSVRAWLILDGRRLARRRARLTPE
ncbi:MAG TPA: hypothetical protein VFN41_12715 [Candidatus Limnocylindrales bacterium]|nr:hypothetical protein [Candidatus Limnocylindrales bacterium]